MIANFIFTTRLRDLPPEVVHQAKRCLLDILGAAFGGLEIKAGQIAIRFSQTLGGPEEATVCGANTKKSYFAAALTNGILASALDVDDGHREALGHPGAVVIPAVLAVAERERTSGKELLEAIVVGYEIGIRALVGYIVPSSVPMRITGSAARAGVLVWSWRSFFATLSVNIR